MVPLEKGFCRGAGRSLGEFPLNGTWSVPNGTLQAWRNTWVASNGANDPSQAQVTNPLPALIGKASGASGGATITAMQAVEPYLAFLGETNMLNIVIFNMR